MFNKTLIILRGLPGSGKSTLASTLYANMDDCAIVSADSFLMENGEYIWSPDRLHRAHESCKRFAQTLMQAGTKIVIIDNTNSKQSDFQPYLEMAAKYDYTVHQLFVENHHGSESIHNVPERTMEKMRQRFGIKKGKKS